ncbi:lipocalin family protein [Chlorobium ferrooxidans]|uniref:Lipocalin-related protein and Bos/Can/Equ allergen n=1 Tax=Chlorobium ferrooxidans DSM 13031 TaxID=377431 RepID=Q0YUR9_9CHLB|nr:lipocalin family protein [Chlorobium ferrooxidans]EAT59964.1 Lipocalin-related protein and Bos/Can/Equ allergen [Chlorobium ferrooxidans DSM 13031]
MKKLLLLGFLLLAGCTGIPQGITVVDNFALDRYLGKWYEIARIDNRFEKGIEQATAVYSLAEDGSVKVLNSGYKVKKRQWKTVTGRGVFIDDTSKGALKVSFFGPFYASYNVIALDRANYSWAVVCGSNRSYFWILSRTPLMERELLEELVGKAGSMGFDTTKIHTVTQQQTE